jgi:hypothetical protein
MGMDIQILLKETFLVLPIYILQQKGIKGLHLQKKMVRRNYRQIHNL